MLLAVDTSVDGVIDTYQKILDAITDETDGRALDAQRPRFVRQCEARMRRMLRMSPVRPMMARQAITVSSEYVVSPSDMVKPIGIELIDGNDRREIDFIDDDQMLGLREQEDYYRDAYPAFSGAGNYPRYFTMTAEGEFRFWPTPDTSRTGTLFYYQDLPTLSDANQSNWMLANHPDAYVDGAIYYAYRAMTDEAKAAAYKTIFEENMQEVLDAYPKPASKATLRVDPMLSLPRRYLTHAY